LHGMTQRLQPSELIQPFETSSTVSV